MAAVLSEPGTAKAVTATPDMVRMSVPIEKAEDTETINPVDGTPDIVIAGKCTDGTLDSDLQLVDPDASLRWIKTWYDTKANIRMGHDPKRPVGRGIEVDGHYVKALIADPTAKHLIRSKVLNDFSVGIMNPEIRRRDPAFKHLPGWEKAVNGVITDRADGLTALGEISVVDRGSNFGSSFALVKAAADGTPEWVGQMVTTGDTPPAAVAKDAKPPKTVDVTLPKSMSMSIKPSQLAKLQTLGRELAMQEAANKMAAAGVTKTAEPDPAGEKLLREIFTEPEPDEATKAAEAGVYKRDIDTATRRRLASEGKALPNLSYPIETREDAHNAATLALSGHGDVSAAKRLIKRIARKEGWTDVLDRLKGKKKDKVAAPEVAKCGTCDGDGMAGGKPCPDCKKGKKAAKQAKKVSKFLAEVREGERELGLLPPVTKKKGKLRAVCPGCGAKQNPEHSHCPECGGKLPARSLTVAKNHDFVCLGCGKNLDKGEKFCPACGKENPGHNPMADQKIPANKAAEGKKKGKGKPFGGQQAAPFGKDKDKEPDGDDDDKPAKKAARVTKRKKGGKKPTPGSASGAVAEGDMTPVPGHREPDGAAMEAFEADAGMSDGDGGSDAQPLPAGIGHSDKQADPELAAAVHLKALGVPQDMGALHALTCPAYDPADVGKAFPHASFAALDLGQWQAADLDKAAFGSLDEMAGLFALGAAASTLKTADPYLLADLRAEAHKAFRDANPGPSTFPTPGELSPSRFNRPYQAEGHAAASPGHDAPRSVKLPPAGGIDAQRFTRGYLTDGRAAESPDNQHTPGPLSTPSPTGAPSDLPGRQYETSFTRNGAQHAISAMHDHISRIFPDICPMEHSLGDYSRPVPSPVGGVKPAPGAKKTAKAAKAKARKAAAAKRKAARALAQKRRSLEAKVLKGKVTVEQAREELGLKPVTKAATATEEAPPAAATVLDPEALAAAVAPLVKRLKRQDKALTAQGKALRKVRRTADAIAAQPDTSAAPFRGTALTKTSAPAVQAPTPAGYAEHAQLNRMYLLQQEVLHNPHPGQREAARAELNTLLGTSTMNPQTTIPMRQ